MVTKVIPDYLAVRVDLADFWRSWSDGVSLDSLTVVDLHEAKDALLAANVPPATAHAYFQRLGGIIANTSGMEWEHFHEIEMICDELFQSIEF